jgi:hypothetical protein
MSADQSTSFFRLFNEEILQSWRQSKWRVQFLPDLKKDKRAEADGSIQSMESTKRRCTLGNAASRE